MLLSYSRLETMGGRLLDLRNQFLEDELSHLLPETAIANRLQGSTYSSFAMIRPG